MVDFFRLYDINRGKRTDYKVTSSFKCNGSDMVVVKLRNCVHAITME